MANPLVDAGDPELMSGESWERFCDELKSAGHSILRDDMPGSPRDRAEGFRYLTRLLKASLETRLEGMDADAPRFITCCTDTQKYGLENPDCWYLQAKLRGDATYRVWGSRGSVRYLGFQITGGVYSYDDPMRIGSATHAEEMKLGPDGSIELILSAHEPPATAGEHVNWLRLDEHSKALLVRQFFYDWENEEPAYLYIERIDQPFVPPVITSGQMQRRLRAVSSWVAKTADFWVDYVVADKKLGINALRPPTAPGGSEDDTTGQSGAGENRYGSAYWVLEPDEALFFEVTPPDCHYWNFQLGSVWWESLDYANRQTAINGFGAHIDPDGAFRCVISNEDPGVQNWLDTTGLREGLLLYRWQLAQSGPTPATTLLKLGEVNSLLHPETPRIDAAERARQTQWRREQVARRFR